MLLKNKIKFSVVFTVLFLLNISQSWSQITATEIVKQMGRGINLGNTLDATNYEGGWAPAAEEDFFQAYKDAGFKTVRIPITWDAAMSRADATPRLSRTAPYTIEPAFLARLDSIIKWGLDRKLIVIINSHHDAWIKNNYNTENKARFNALWVQISEHYKDYNDSLVFEILNEPHTSNSAAEGGITREGTEELMRASLATIRKTNPTRNVIYTGSGWGNSGDLLASNLSELNDSYLIGTYHSYDPSAFGLDGIGTWGSENNIMAMVTKIQSVYDFSQSTGIPILLGEFGAVRQADFNSRMRYYGYYTKIALSRNFAFTVWDDNGQFQTLKRSSLTWDLTKDILVDYQIKSPEEFSISMGASRINMTWKNVATDIKSTKIQLQDAQGVFQTIKEVASDVQSYTDSDITDAGKFYRYRVVNVLNDNSELISYPQEVFITPTDREPFHGTPFTIPGSFEAEDFDKGGQGLTYFDNSSSNQADYGSHNYRPNDWVDIEPRIINNVFEDNYQIGYAEKGEWMEYTIDVQKSANYIVTFSVASMAGGGILRFQTNNSYFIDTEIPATNSWTTLTDVSSVPVTLEQGEHYARLTIISDDGGFNIDKITLTETNDVASTLDQLQTSSFSFQNNILNIAVDKNLDKETIQIFDLSGNLVLLKQISNDTHVDLNYLNNGAYIIQIGKKVVRVTKF